MHPMIEAVLIEQGVIAARDHPRLESSLAKLALSGTLDRALPGIFVPAGAGSGIGWLRAVAAWSAPAGVLHGTSAASLWLPEQGGPVAFVAHPTLRGRRGVVVCRRSVPAEFVLDGAGLRATSPAYTAAELAAQDDGRAACEALRLRLATPEELVAATAALAGSRGHVVRKRVIAACADNPWSYAELRLHRILREAGIRGWVANKGVRIDGDSYVPDALFAAERVVIEVDGRRTHEPPGQFRRDRERQNAFTMAGYRVIRFTWEHLDQPDYVVTVTRAVLRRHGR